MPQIKFQKIIFTWKLILIWSVITVLVLTIAGIIACCQWQKQIISLSPFKFTKPEARIGEYNLTIQVKEWVTGRSVKAVTVEILVKDTGQVIDKAETDDEGKVVFVLPKNKYTCQIAQGNSWAGGIDVELIKDTSVELKALETVY